MAPLSPGPVSAHRVSASSHTACHPIASWHRPARVPGRLRTVARDGSLAGRCAVRSPRGAAGRGDDELHAVLSQATAVKRQPAGQKFKSALGTNSFEVPEASCQIEFDLPGNGEPEHANVHVTLDFVGSEFYVKQNYDDYGTEVALPGADMCHRTSVAYKCRKGGVDFTLSGGVTKDVNFAGQKGAARAFYVDRVLVEYVKLILAKLP
jgi:hypothetical protein